ncbi:DUF1345 domain-containing protein [Leucobacter sp. HY1910]
MTGTARSGSQRWRTAVGLAVAITGILMQLWLVWLGAKLLWGPDDGFDILRLLVWCAIATLYLGATAITLTVGAMRERPDALVTRTIVGHPITRLLSVLFTFGSSFIGLSVAIDLITSLGMDQHDAASEAAAVWAMLLSWAMFNWGYARIYYSRYLRAKMPPLKFPGTPEPKLVDFAYLSFTNATTFAVSDVQVLSSRMRWTIVWHTSIAFFFNAMIIVLTMNVIANGKMFADLFG